MLLSLSSPSYWAFSKGCVSLLPVTPSSSLLGRICQPVTVITPVCEALSASVLSGQLSQELTQNHKLIALSEPFV